MGSFVSFVGSLFFEYDTVKYVHIRSKAIGLLSRFIQLSIIGYLIGYAIVWKKGYQEFSDIESAVTTKVKGVVFSNFSNSSFAPDIDPSLYNRIWDVEDLVVPSSENEAFFITTNIVITAKQKRGVCPEDPKIPGAECTSEKNTCREGVPLMLGNGVMTGLCVQPDRKPCVQPPCSCQVEAWCPVEDDVMPLKNGALLAETKNFTVLIKNSIDFPKFKIRRRNIIDRINNSTYLQNCRYSAEENPDCPVFVIGDIIHYANEDEKAKGGKPMEYEEVAVKGGVYAIVITWDCNLDLNVEKCLPKYSFKRLDDPKAKIAGGWNFRYGHYYNDNERTLYKAYGIKFVIQVHGQGGKFSAFPLILTIGASMALLAIESNICDIVLLYFSKYREHYRDKKYEVLMSDENTIDGLSEPRLSSAFDLRSTSMPAPGFQRFS